MLSEATADLGAGRTACAFTERCFVVVLKGRRFEHFAAGDAGLVRSVDHDAQICHVLFEGSASTTPVAMRHLKVVSPPLEARFAGSSEPPAAYHKAASSSSPPSSFRAPSLGSRPHPCCVTEDDELFPQTVQLQMVTNEVDYYYGEPYSAPESWPQPRVAVDVAHRCPERSAENNTANPVLLELAGLASTDSDEQFTVVTRPQNWPSRRRVDTCRVQRVPVPVEAASSSSVKLGQCALDFMDSSEGFAAGLSALTDGLGEAIKFRQPGTKQSPISAVWGARSHMSRLDHFDAFGNVDNLHAPAGMQLNSFSGALMQWPGSDPYVSPRLAAPLPLTPPSLAVDMCAHPATPLSARGSRLCNPDYPGAPLARGQCPMQPSVQPFPNLWHSQHFSPPPLGRCGPENGKQGSMRQLSPPWNILEGIHGLPNLLECRQPMPMH